MAAIVAAAFLLLWWLRAERVEAPAPPAIESAAPSFSEPQGDDAHNEITDDEKQDLERILRERSAPHTE